MSAPQDIGNQVEKLDDSYFAYGDHSDAYRGKYLGHPVVIKALRGVNSNKTDVRDELHQSLREHISLWVTLDHPNVCKIFGLASGFGFLPALILAYHEKGSIIKNIQKRNPPALKRMQWVFEVAEGLAYLHDKGVHHGDLRGANIFLDANDHAVIADYSIAHYFANSDFTSAKSVGNVRWMAPEIVTLPPKPDILPYETDVYSLAMVMVEIFSGQPPYYDKSDTAVIFSIAKYEMPKLPEEITSNTVLHKLFNDCTKRDPFERPKAKGASETLKTLVFPPPSILQRIFRFFWLA